MSTANLAAIVVVVLLAFVNIFGVGLGAVIQNIFTSAKAISLAALILLAFTVGRTAEAWNANFGAGLRVLEKRGMEFAAPGAGGRGRPDGAGEPGGDSGGGAGGIAVLRGCVEQHHVYGRGSEESEAQFPLSLILGTGFVLTVYFLVSLGYLLVLPMHGDPHGATVAARGIQYAAEDRVATAALGQIFHSAAHG